MLLRLEIENIALIDKLSLDFEGGLTILSGETGSGKSILIDSVSFVLGSRADKELIRSGCDSASVQAVFDASGSPQALDWLSEREYESEDGIVTVSRQISLSGRSVVRLAGQVVSLAQLRSFTGLLADIHGQHEHQSLLAPQNHMPCLDSFAAESIETLIEKTSLAYKACTQARKELESITGTPQERARRIDLLEYELNEIEDAKLEPGQEEMLLERRAFFRNAERIAQAVLLARETLTGSAPSKLKAAAQALESVSRFDPWFEKTAERLNDFYYQLEDLSYEAANKADEMEYDPAEADIVEDRLSIIAQLKRKYGSSIDEILGYAQRARDELDKLSRGQALMEELTKRVESAQTALIAACDELSAARKRAAEDFCAAVVGHLRELSMEKTRFDVCFGQKDPSANGSDDVEFLISPNPGEPLRPLAKIASGGELSRIMLALKSITAQKDGISTMIFDEIDTGISGKVAISVAAKLSAISKARQALCVTHLASIAAAGDNHFLIEKSTDGGRTATRVTRLTGEARVAEIARLSGGTTSQSALALAREMLNMRKK